MLGESNSPLGRAVQDCCRGEYQRAVRRLRRAVRRDPNDGRLWETLGMAYGGLEEHVQSADALERAALLKPLTTAAQCTLAQVYGRLGRPAEASDIWQHLATLNEVPVDLLPSISAGLGRSGLPAAAAQVCRRALRHNPDDESAWFALAHFLSRQGAPLSRITSCLRRAFALAPDRLEYRLSLAFAYRRSDHVGLAYRLVAQLSLADLGRLRCQRCLGQLIELYEQAADELQLQACRGRLRNLGVADTKRSRD